MVNYSPRRVSHGRNRKKIKGGLVSLLLIIAALGCLYSYRFVGDNKSAVASVPSSDNSESFIEPVIQFTPEQSSEEVFELTESITPKYEPTTDVEPAVETVESVESSGRLSDISPDSDPQFNELLGKAQQLLDASPSKIIEARDLLNASLSLPMSAGQRMSLKRMLTQLSDKWLFTRTVVPGDKLCSVYMVKPGENLWGLGKRFQVPSEIIMQINNIKDARSLQAGQAIKVINGPFHARVRRSTFTMDLYLNDTYVRSFRVCLGRPGMETPTGLWCVKPDGKLISPTWTDPDTGKTYEADDPDYPLGSRWIGLEGLKGQAQGRTGFAIHGTNNEASIGTQSSRGCIRLADNEAILMFNLLMGKVSQVEVIE